MLVSLHVKNLALIEETEIFFGTGLNILTGETGAGKSVILGSVALALGAKADKDMIRTGAEYALIELHFEVTQEIAKKIAGMDILVEDGQVLLQRRILPARSICRVNGETVSAKLLRELAGLLIDIHGQHDSQMLLQTRRHLEILDQYAGEDCLADKEALRKVWQAHGALEREIAQNRLDETARKRELSLAQYEVSEIEAANLQEGEDERLEKDYRRMENAQEIAKVMGTVYGLTGYDLREGAGESIGRALRELSGVVSFDGDLEDMYRQLEEVDGLLNDFNRSVSEYAGSHEFDEETFAAVQERLNQVNRLKDKYGRTIAQVLAYGEDKKAEAERLLHQDAWLEEKQAQCQKAHKAMLALAAKLTKKRQKAAERFDRQMGEALRELNFLHVAFRAEISPKQNCSAEGMDDVTFLISTNPGEPLKPLADVASGGELSRIMLALKTVTAGQEQIGTFIFDEIDAGISGKTAWKVSQKLGLLSRSHQILCITHLPQIAAMADHHFYMEKNAVDQKTATTVAELSYEESLQELARLSGAVTVTDTVLQNAREMKEAARHGLA